MHLPCRQPHIQTKCALFTFSRSSHSKGSSYLWSATLPSHRCSFAMRAEITAWNTTACTCGEGLSRSENSRGPAQAPAEQRGYKPCHVVAAAAARHFLDVLHVPWKNTSLSASSVKSAALYQCTKECEWRIKITKLTDGHTWKWMEKQWNRDMRKYNL